MWIEHQQWPMKRVLMVDLKGFQWCIVTQHTVQTKLIYKNQTYQQISMFTATGGLKDVPFVVLAHSVGIMEQ
jgi:hypothetical protein